MASQPAQSHKGTVAGCAIYSDWVHCICRIDKPKALSLLLHTADISHPAKHWELHHRWTASLLEEFFQQVAPAFLLQAHVRSE